MTKIPHKPYTTARDRGEQIHEERYRLLQPAWCELGEKDGGSERKRRREYECDRRRNDGTEDSGCGTELSGLNIPLARRDKAEPEGVKRRPRRPADRDGDQEEKQRYACRESGGEYCVRSIPGARSRDRASAAQRRRRSGGDQFAGYWRDHRGRASAHRLLPPMLIELRRATRFLRMLSGSGA